MKGMSLPINLVVIIAICVLVLLAVAAFFAGGFGSGAASIGDSSALQKGCGMWKSQGCKLNSCDIGIVGYDYDADGVPNMLSDACQRVLGSGLCAETTDQCFIYCCSER